MNLSKKLFLTAIIPMLIILLTGGIATWQTNRIFNEFASVNDTYDANARAALEIQVDLTEQIHQWKNILIRGDNPDDLARYRIGFQRIEEEIDADCAALILGLGQSKAAPKVQEFIDAHKKLSSAYSKSLDVFLVSHYDRHQADNLVKGADRELSELLKISVEMIQLESDNFSRKAQDDARYVALINSLSMLLVIFIASLYYLKSLKKNVLIPVKLMTIFANKFIAGDYNQRIAFKSNDEFGTLTETLNNSSLIINSLVTNLEASKTTYQNLIAGIDAIIWELDTQTKKYTFVSQRAEELLGYPPSTWLSEAGFFEKICHPSDIAAYQKKISEILDGGTSGEFTFRAITSSGSIIWLNNRIRVVKNEQSSEVSLLGVTVDITRMKQYEDQAAYLTTHDKLTDLPNRNLFTDRLERAIDHASVKKNKVALMLVNIDRFKSINESFGNDFGDEVIKAIALRLKNIVVRDGTLAYLGSDEFAIVLRDVVKPEEAAEIAMEVIRLISMPLMINRNALIINCTIGISMFPKDGHYGREMLKNAGSALTRAKQKNKGGFKFYTEEMNAQALASLQLETKMRRAIKNQEFVLHYQPQINIVENRMTGVEALIRWMPPGENMISPMTFIPLAEETKLILPIGEWVMREACRQNKAWQDKGFAPFCVAVNLSSSQFSQPDIVAQVTRVLEETELDPQYLELEITESVMMSDIELVISNLAKLHSLGVKLAIDDFGTGYSSLSYLNRLPIHKLKIDKSFVDDIPVNSNDEPIVSTIIAMAHNLKIGVIAEGVETELQLQYLREKKCEEIQGYYFSKPLTVDSLEEFMSNNGLFGQSKVENHVTFETGHLTAGEHEYVVTEGVVLVSKTDLKGNITYCNKAFVEVSGFLESELLGQPHNIVRHPNVPKRIFTDIWNTIQSGNSWHGVVKNRRKNSDFYWVAANITPISENGRVTGYLSLRYKASTEQIVKAEKYFLSVHNEKFLPLFFNKPDKNYVGKLQQQLADSIIAQEVYLERKEMEQRIAAGYMSKLIAVDKLQDPAVRFYLKPADNFSGDLIAVSRTPDSRLHLLLADSTGHGLSAALAAMPMIHPFYSMSSKGFSISAIASEINNKVWQTLPVGHFVAAILVSIDSVGQMVEVWSGGCPPPVLLDSEGACAHQFSSRHLAMGILRPEQFDSSVEYYSYDDDEYSLLMFSDGIIELENENGEQFGTQRLLEAAQATDIEARWQHLTGAIESYGGGNLHASDDISLIMARCEFRGKVSRQGAQTESKSQDQSLSTVVWQFALTLDMYQIKKLDVVPFLLDIVQQIEKDKTRGGEIFMILSELFNNALDHGLLKLDSGLKHHEDGMEKYFAERAIRLANAENGIISLSMEKTLNESGDGVLRIRVKDSGAGFDHQSVTKMYSSDMSRHGRGFALLYNLCSTLSFIGNGAEVVVEFNLSNDSNNKISSQLLS